MLIVATVLATVTLGFAGVVTAQPAPPLVFLGSALASSVGQVQGNARFVNTGTTPAGELTFGPYTKIEAGSYIFGLTL